MGTRNLRAHILVGAAELRPRLFDWCEDLGITGWLVVHPAGHLACVIERMTRPPSAPEIVGDSEGREFFAAQRTRSIGSPDAQIFVDFAKKHGHDGGIFQYGYSDRGFDASIADVLGHRLGAVEECYVRLADPESESVEKYVDPFDVMTWTEKSIEVIGAVAPSLLAVCEDPDSHPLGPLGELVDPDFGENEGLRIEPGSEEAQPEAGDLPDPECRKCWGAGRLEDSRPCSCRGGWRKCRMCGGKGRKWIRKCQFCKGAGRTPCSSCHGSGTTLRIEACDCVGK